MQDVCNELIKMSLKEHEISRERADDYTISGVRFFWQHKGKALGYEEAAAMLLSADSEVSEKSDWQDRFRDEYYQLRTRARKLEAMMSKYRVGELDFTPNCSYDLLEHQYRIMQEYLWVLEKRAWVEDIDLEADE